MEIDILYVDDNDNVIGAGPRIDALSKNIAHRIVRIFAFNSRGEVLIQKRSLNIDFPGMWDQSAAGHVDVDETYEIAAKRELAEEVGISGVPLRLIKKYYSEEPRGDIVMKRFNALYTANYDGPIEFQEEEVSETRWISLQELDHWMNSKPEEFTDGFKTSYKEYLKTSL